MARNVAVASHVLALLSCASAQQAPMATTMGTYPSAPMYDVASGVAMEKTNNSDPEVWHLLSRDVQHTLASVIERFDDPRLDEDLGVNALLSGLLHDELEVRQQAAPAEFDVSTLDDIGEVSQFGDREHYMPEKDNMTKLQHYEVERITSQQRAEQERNRIEHENQMEQMKLEREKRNYEHDQFMERSRARVEASKKRHAEAMDQHQKRWERMSTLLKEVHVGLEEMTGGWQDIPFWDSFFNSTSTIAQWGQLSLEHLKPVIQADPLLPEHHVLVLEPGHDGLAGRLAEAVRQLSIRNAQAFTFGEEAGEDHDLVVEIGLLDAMAMGGDETSGTPRLQALNHAAARISKLVRPGGSWISLSVVPPTLREPLLVRLGRDTFALSTGSAHTITLPALSKPDTQTAARLRGAAQVANLVLYGSEDAHVWAYRLQRLDSPSQDVQSENGGGHSDMAESHEELLDVIRQQRPGTRDDL